MLPRKTIWHVSSNRWNSAITEYCLSTARALQLQGFHNVLSPLQGSPAEHRAKSYGLSLEPLPHFQWYDTLAFQRLAAKIKPDLVITYNGAETFLAKFLPRNLPIWRFRGQEVRPLSTAAIWWQSLAALHIDALLAPSATMAERLRRQTRLPVHAITLGCPETIFHRQPKTPSLPPTRPTLLIFGRFDPIKGHADFMARFKECLRLWPSDGAVPRPQLRIVGEAANVSVAMLEDSARYHDLALGDEILIEAARVADVPAMMREASLGVVSSLGSEIICRVAEEFLLCGTPVFVSGVGSLNDVLFAPEAGASYMNKGIDESALLLRNLAMRSFLETEERKIARAAAAAKRFSLAIMGQQLATVVTETLSHHKT